MVKAEAKKRMLITGVSGLLGSNLAYYFKDQFNILGLYNHHPVQMDGVVTKKGSISNPGDIKELISEFDPQVIVHCASLTSIDECENDREMTREVNATATGYIVNAIINRDVMLIYISSDSVYDGLHGNFSENDPANPQNYYGLSKYEGELEVSKRKEALVLRTNLFGWNIQDKNSLGEWILTSLLNHETINCFKDAHFSSIYTMELARIIDIAIQKKLKGIYNCGSVDSCSKYDFAVKVCQKFGLDDDLIKPISIADSTLKAKRGKCLSLDVSRIQNDLDYMMPDIDSSIDLFYRDYKCRLPEKLKNYGSYPAKSDFIPYGRQAISSNDIQSVVENLQSGEITQGSKIADFEETLARYCQAEYAVAVNSGTSALQIACMAAGVKTGSEVITSPITFVASANCAVYCGASPVFADIDPETYNLSPGDVEKKITARTRAIIPVHFAGQSCDMAAINEIARSAEQKYGHRIFIIEDGSHAIGSSYKGKKIGSCAYSEMAVTSFHPVKHITTGEGGAIFTNDLQLATQLIRLRSHGITSTPSEFVYSDQAFPAFSFKSTSPPNPWYYEQQELGFNYRITDFQCVLGQSQLKRIEEFRLRRREIVNIYNASFSGANNIQTPFEAPDCHSNFHLYVLLINFEEIGIQRAEFIYVLRDRGIQTQVHYIPVHTQPFYQKNFNTRWGDCPNAEEYYQKCLSIPLFPTLTTEDIKRVVSEVFALTQNG